jgi:hypothetical protein
MLVLLQDGCPVPADVRLWDRLLTRLRAARLDGDLAAGASPDATVGLSLRARMLVRMPARRQLVLAEAALGPAADRLPVPVCRDRIEDCSAELLDLIRRLLAAGPVSAQGVAQARALLTNASSPVYHRASRDDLRARVLAAADALTPC